MFPSSNSQNPFSYSTETFFKHPYNTYDQNPNSAHEEPPFISSFTSPFLGDHELPLSEILHQKSSAIDHADVVGEDQNIMNNNSTSMGKNISTEMANDQATIQPKPCEVKPSRRRNDLDVKAPRKRTGKKDRHSKIRTAQGVRDRRMRLSLQIARKFFDLQDMLGFDKASKTIEWLFSKSKKAIKELNRNVQQTNYSNESESHMSEYCEVVSAMEENYSNNEGTNVNIAAKDVTLMNDPYETQSRKSPKVAYNFHHARESRDKARARARERTKEKMMIKSLEKNKQLYESYPNNLDQLGSTFSPFETLEESTSCTKKSYSHDQADSNSTEYHQFGNVGINGNYLGTTESFTQVATCPFFSYQNNAELSHGLDFNNSFLGFLGNWDTNSIRINSSNDGVMNMVSLGGNYPASTRLATSRFPFQLQ